jgi:hypothetical protein
MRWLEYFTIRIHLLLLVVNYFLQSVFLFHQGIDILVLLLRLLLCSYYLFFQFLYLLVIGGLLDLELYPISVVDLLQKIQVLKDCGVDLPFLLHQV